MKSAGDRCRNNRTHRSNDCLSDDKSPALLCLGQTGKRDITPGRIWAPPLLPPAPA